MGESKILNSLHHGNWAEENLLTGGIQDNNKFDILNNAIGRYTNELQSYISEETKFLDKDMDIPILQLPEFAKQFDILNAKRYSKKIQSWQGIVLSINKRSFHAKLYDLNVGGTDEIGEFELEDISPDDLHLLAEGAIFYWSVGHYMENGQSLKKSEIRFQRLITLDEDDIEQTQRNIEKKYSKLKERKIDNQYS
ncbi:MAG TPA: hypothetical protein PLD02_13605 [Saprospiraceae bacterium]|nr:hypothetical protein [Saprospiraceae bacterium]